MEGIEGVRWWEYLENISDENNDYYETEDGELAIFDYENKYTYKKLYIK
jgi:hypothetical protein